MNKEKNRFSGKAENYVKGRPAYSAELLEYMADTIGLTSEKTVADIGAGTGIFSKQLLERGCKVVCIEPNDDMRAAAVTTLEGLENISIIDGTAEDTTLEKSSVDLITVAQAFHWFDVDKFKVECKRILKENGIVCLIWNHRDTETEFSKAYQAIFAKYCPNYKGFSGGLQKDDERIRRFFNDKYVYAEFENNITYDRQQFITRCLSSSYALKPCDAEYEKFLSALNQHFDHFENDGVTVEPNRSVIYWNRLSDCFERTQDEIDSKIKFPFAVTEMNLIKGYSLIKAWRIYRGKTQKELAAALGITQSAFSQIEKSEHNQKETLRKVAAVLEVEPEHLTLDD